MSIPSFTRGYPQDGSSLGNSKATIRNNLDGTFLAFSVEHFSQNTATPGLHQVSTYPVGARKSTASGQINIYSKAVTGGSALFSSRDNKGSAGEVQLTTPLIVPAVSSSAIQTFLPGGIVMLSGSTARAFVTTGDTLVLTLPFTFPNFIISATASLIQNSSNTVAAINVKAPIPVAGPINKVTFIYTSGQTTSNYIGVSWTVIGY